MSDGSFQIPPGSENDDLGPPFRDYLIFLTILTIASIGLRLWSRGLVDPLDERRRWFWWDDWAAVASVPCILAQLIMAIVLVSLGVGKHIWFVPLENLTIIMKLLFATYIIYGFALTITKASALFFFSRIFPRFATPGWWNLALWITHGLNAAWLIAYTLVEIFQCQPISTFWDLNPQGTCMPQRKIYIGAAVPSVVIDLMILILPVPMLWGLNTSRARRAGIFIVFALGYAVVIVSIGRLVTALQFQDGLDTDLTYEGMASFWWGILEAPITLFGVCLPAMLTLGRRVKGGFFSPLASKISTALSMSVLKSKNGAFSADASAQHTVRLERGGKRARPFESTGLGSTDSLNSGTQRDPQPSPG